MEVPHLFSLPRTAKWRAKLCRLGYENWQVSGEGNVYGEYDRESGRYTSIMEDQYDPSRILFRSSIRPPVAFQKQDALLLWNGPEEDINNEAMSDGDMEFWQDENGLARVALAFQVMPGCASISEFVLYAIAQSTEKQGIAFAIQQGGHVNDFANQSNSSTSPTSFERYAEIVEEPIKYPPSPNRHNLAKIHTMISDLSKFSLGRELLIVFLASKDYSNQLWSVFVEIVPDTNPKGALNGHEQQRGESFMSPLERIQSLWRISDIIKQYMTAGDALLIDKITEPDAFLKILSMLEYDRSFGTRKANFRDYYCEQTGMKQVIEMVDSPVSEKIQRTFRLQMLRDVLVRSSDDVTFNISRSLINVNHAEISENLQNSPEFCAELFALFRNTKEHPLTQTSKPRDDAIEFINEVMKTSKIMSVPQLRLLYIRLLESGLINAMTYGLHSMRRCEIKSSTLETLSIIFEIDMAVILPSHGSSISQAIVNMVYDVPIQSTDHISTEDTAAAKASARAMQLESSDLLKKVLVDFPQETFGQFFEFLGSILSQATPENDSDVEGLLPLLDILTHCFSSNPELTATMMSEYNIWDQIAHVSILKLKNLGPVTSSKLSMCLIRLVRESIQPTSTVSTSVICDQAQKITESGVLAPIFDTICEKPLVNDAEHSSFLNLLHTVVNGRINGYGKQYKIMTRWIINRKKSDIKCLCDAYPFTKEIIPEHVLEHIFDDEDDSNLIVIRGISRKPKNKASAATSKDGNISSQTEDVSDKKIQNNPIKSATVSKGNDMSNNTDWEDTVPLKRSSSQNLGHDDDPSGSETRKHRRAFWMEPGADGQCEILHSHSGSSNGSENSTNNNEEIVVISREDFPVYQNQDHSSRYDHAYSRNQNGACNHPWWNSPSHRLSPRGSIESDDVSSKTAITSSDGVGNSLSDS